MTAVIIAGFCFLASPQGTLPPPTVLQTEQAVNPPAVTDHRPDFRAQNPFTQTADRFRLQVTTNADAGFLAPLWSSAASPGGLAFPGGNVLAGAMSSEIPYGQGTANLLSLPLLDWGATYRWRIAMGRSNNNNTWTSFSAPATFTMDTPSRAINQHQNNGSPTVDSWRLIGVPIAFGTTVPATELLNSVPLLYKLDEPNRTWIQMTAGDVLEGGRGYLGWCSPTTVLSLSQGKVTAGIPPVKDGAGATVTPSYLLTGNFSFTTQGAPTGREISDGVPANDYRGNHIFANPFNAPISWRSSTNPPPSGVAYGHIARSNISYAMYKWDGTQYLTYNGVTDAGTAGEWIEPFQAVGVWVQATPFQFYLDTPAPTTGGSQKATMASKSSSATPPAPDPDSWHLRIEARSGAAMDTENAFGINTEADDAWDVRDSEEPGPGTATWLLVSMDHRSDWTTYAKKYTHDFRKTPLKAGNQVTWTFTVDGNTGLPATLTWPNLGNVPPGDWKFTLEDPAGPTVLDLSTASSYDTAPVNGPSTMTLRATRLKDSPAPASVNGGGSGGGNCGLLGLDGLLLAAALLARRFRR